MSKSIEEIVSLFEEAEKMPLSPKKKPLKEGYITDEDKSVRWNREQVEQSQQTYREETLRLRQERNQMLDKAKQEIILYIKDSLEKDFSEEKCNLILSRAYEENHAYGLTSVINRVDEYVDFINDLLE